MNSQNEVFVKKFDSKIKENILATNVHFFERKAIGVAVSGGADSVSLLISLSHLSKQYNFPLRVISVNHNIRKYEESFADVKYVEFLCDSIKKDNVDIKFSMIELKKGEVENISLNRKKGIEEAARYLRYKAYSDFFINEKLSCICLGHNLNDNIETVLMRFLQGSSFDGLCGIQFSRDFYIRPLLSVSRADIEKYLNIQNIKWQTDKTNLDNKYFRNKIRLDLIPFLNEKFPGWNNALLSGIEKNNYYHDLITKSVDKYIWQQNKDGELYFELNDFKSLEKGVQLQLFYKGFVSLDIDSRIPFKFIKNVLNNLDNDFEISIDDVVFKINKNYIFLKKKKIIATENGFFAIIEKDGTYNFPFGSVSVEIKSSKAMIYFGSVVLSDVSVPFCIRSRQLGDSVEASNGELKSVSDILSSWHIDTDIKDKIPLVQELKSENQNIVAIIGSVYNYQNWIVRGFYE